MIKDEYEKCKESSFRILEKRNVTTKEMEDKLIKRGYSNEVVDRTILFLLEYGYLNDEEYAKNYYNSHIKKDGIKKIKYNLIIKGISDDVLASLEQNEEVELDNALNLAKRKYEQIIKRENDLYKVRHKLTNYLMSRGYQYQLIKKVVEETVKWKDENFLGEL